MACISGPELHRIIRYVVKSISALNYLYEEIEGLEHFHQNSDATRLAYVATPVFHNVAV